MEEIPSSASSPVSHSIVFHGKTREFFKIWIVNIILTILTLGIYSAWGKVRSKKYLYGNTELLDSRFDYHGDPIKILKGRLLVGALFIGYTLGGKISPAVAAVFFAILLGLTPWIIVRALAFNLSNSSYRNIRFGFKIDYRGSYVTYIKSLCITLISVGLGTPYAAYLHSCFRLNRIRFGREYFQFHADSERFFSVFIKALLFYAFGIAIFVAVILLKAKAIVAIGFVTLYLGMIAAGAWIHAGVANLNANGSGLKDVRFHSTLSGWTFVQIYLTNFLACVFTLGLAIPWAIVRTLRYRIENTKVILSDGAFDALAADSITADDSTKADAIVDFWDMDLGI